MHFIVAHKQMRKKVICNVWEENEREELRHYPPQHGHFKVLTGHNVYFELKDIHCYCSMEY